MSSSRQQRRLQTRADRRTAQQIRKIRGLTVPLPVERSDERRPGMIRLSVKLENATLNWQAPPADIARAFDLCEQAWRKQNLTLDGAKRAARDLIIRYLVNDEHLKQENAEILASAAMWYMWLKKPYGDRWDDLERLVMMIEQTGPDDYQFKWGIDVKRNEPLPELQRLDVLR